MSTRQVGTIDKKTIELLGLSIAPDTPILLGESNINHMKESHPEDYEKYFSGLEAILATPDYVNLNPRDGSIKYIKTIDEHVVVGVRVSTKGLSHLMIFHQSGSPVIMSFFYYFE